MLEFEDSERTLLRRRWQATRGSHAPFSEKQSPRVISPPLPEWWMRFDQGALEPLHLNLAWHWVCLGSPDVASLECAVRALARRHEILSCSLMKKSSEVRLVSNGAPEPCVPSWTTTCNSPEAASDALHHVAYTPFDVRTEGPIRVGATIVSSTAHIITVVVHHSFADMYSLRIISHELAALYHSLRNGHRAQLPDLPLQFSDYLLSEDAWTSGPLAPGYLSYWSKYLDQAAGIPHSRTPNVQVSSTTLPARLSEDILAFCRATRTSLGAFLEAAHHVSIWRLLGRDDVTSLSMNAGRRQVELVRLIGNFVTLLPQRTKFRARMTFAQLLDQMKQERQASLPFICAPYMSIAEQCTFNYLGEVGVLNYTPQSFLPLETFGSHLIPPPSADPSIFERPWFPFPYVIGITGSTTLQLYGYGAIREPFELSSLLQMFTSVLRAAAAEPNTPLLSFKSKSTADPEDSA